MDMNADLWSKLPSEVLEEVLPFVPVPDLCRYRSVCKRWNSLIRTPEFGALCVRNATNGVTKGACFVVKLRFCIDSAETGRRCKEISSWSIFDLDTKRWYNVEDELPKGYDYQVGAMDGGLVCTFVNAVTDEQRWCSTIYSEVTQERQILIVSNLIERRAKVLPDPPLRHIYLVSTSLNLVVDDISQTYKIFLISAGSSWINRGPRMLCL